MKRSDLAHAIYESIDYALTETVLFDGGEVESLEEPTEENGYVVVIKIDGIRHRLVLQ